MNQPNDDFNNRVAAYWSRVASRKELGFWDIPGWVTHQNLLASQDPQISWLDIFSRLLGQQNNPRHALSIGCGQGYYEKLLLEKKLAGSVDACDISPALIERAQTKADTNGLPIRYFVQDLNHPSIPEQKYDVIFAAGILHHIVNLEVLFPAIKRALKPNGRFIVYDYVGPSRFQWKPQQIARCNYWLDQLPRHFKRKRGYPWYYYLGKSVFDALPFLNSKPLAALCEKTLPHRMFAHWVRLQKAQLVMNEVLAPPPEQFLVTDPSEAIRSDEILSVMQQHFQVEKLLPQGGTLAQPLFSRTVANFLNDAEGIQHAQRILEDERQQIATGSLSSDFVALMAAPR